MFRSILPAPLRRFTRDDTGYANVESIILLPALLWLFGVGWVYFDAFHQQSINQKANYVIGDMISRETDPLDETYIRNTRNLLSALIHSTSEDTDFRASVVQYDARHNDWDLVWSDAYGTRSRLKQADLTDYFDRLPPAIDNEQLILVETWDNYAPVFKVGLDPFEIATYSFTSPRYTSQVVWEGSASAGGGNNNSGNSNNNSGGGNSGGGSSGGSSGSGGGGGGGGWSFWDWLSGA
ncbi:TadE/TadG family type IV pilus assembly protein [Sagittula stellata]|nr:hypothetical protein [Sagittula stellata]